MADPSPPSPEHACGRAVRPQAPTSTAASSSSTSTTSPTAASFVARHEGRVVFVSRRDPGRARRRPDHRRRTKPVLARRDPRGAARRRPHRQAARLGGGRRSSAPRRPRRAAPSSATSDSAHQRELKARGAARGARAHRRRRGRRRRARGRRVAGSRRHAPTARDGAPACACTSTTTGVVGPYAARSHTVVPVADLPARAPRAARDRAAATHGSPGARAHRPRRARRRATPAIVLVERRADAARPAPDDRASGSATASSGSTPTGSGRCTAARRPPSARAVAGRSIDPRPLRSPTPRTSTSTAGSGCSPRRSATGSARRRGSRPSSPTRAPPSTRARTSPSGSARRAVTARVDRFARRLAAEARRGGAGAAPRATVVLDPPRSGAGRAVVDALAALAPAPARLRRLRSGRARPRRRAPPRARLPSSPASTRSTCSRTRTTSRRWRG